MWATQNGRTKSMVTASDSNVSMSDVLLVLSLLLPRSARGLGTTYLSIGDPLPLVRQDGMQPPL